MGRIGAERPPAQAPAGSGMTPAALMEDWQPAAVKQIRTRLIRRSRHGPQGQCSDDDLAAEYERMAAPAGASAERSWPSTRDAHGDRLRDHIKEVKEIASIWENGKVKAGKKIKFVDLFEEKRIFEGVIMNEQMNSCDHRHRRHRRQRGRLRHLFRLLKDRIVFVAARSSTDLRPRRRPILFLDAEDPEKEISLYIKAPAAR
jgi:hypothetical protein